MADKDAKVVIMTVRATSHSTKLPAAGGLFFRAIQPSEDVAVLTDIGRIALYSAYVERLLDRMTWLLMGGDPAAHAPETSKLPGADQRFAKIATTGAGKPLFDAEIAPLLGPLRQRAADLWDARARIIHDPWYLEEDGVSTRQFRAMPKKGPAVFEHVEVSLTEVVQVVDRLVALWNDLAPIHDRIADLYAS